MAMLQSLGNAFRLPQLRNRILFTALMLAVLRIGVVVTVPGVDPAAIAQMQRVGGLLQVMDLFTGGAFATFAIFALGVTPYINSSIIVQLLTVIIPRWEEMQKEGEEGRKKLQQYTRYGTVVLGLFQAFAMSYSIRSAFYPTQPLWASVAISMITLTAGSAFLMWAGELITEKGIGNGISLIIFANIVARLPVYVKTQFVLAKSSGQWLNVIGVALISIMLIYAVIMITEGVRKIPVEYARRVVGTRSFGGQKSHLPMKINQAGVIPVIFAQSLLYLPMTIAGFTNPTGGFATFVTKWFNQSSPWFLAVNALFIIFFTYFYTAVTFNPTEIADNMKKNGSFIPGYRPGKPTAEYLSRISDRLTIVGALFLAILTVFPFFIMKLTGDQQSFVGGTGMLIVVGVGLETMRQIESQLVVRSYQGFMRS